MLMAGDWSRRLLGLGKEVEIAVHVRPNLIAAASDTAKEGTMRVTIRRCGY